LDQGSGPSTDVKELLEWLKVAQAIDGMRSARDQREEDKYDALGQTVEGICRLALGSTEHPEHVDLHKN
jgi:hypothetical protein